MSLSDDAPMDFEGFFPLERSNASSPQTIVESHDFDDYDDPPPLRVSGGAGAIPAAQMSQLVADLAGLVAPSSPAAEDAGSAPEVIDPQADEHDTDAAARVTEHEQSALIKTAKDRASVPEPLGFAFPFNGGLNGAGVASIGGGELIGFNDLDELASVGRFIVCAPSQGFAARSACSHAFPGDTYPTLASMLAIEVGAKLVTNPADPKGECGKSVRTLAAIYTRAERHLHALAPAAFVDAANMRTPRSAVVKRSAWLGGEEITDGPASSIAQDLSRPMLRASGTPGKRDITLRLQGGRAGLLQKLLQSKAPGPTANELPPTITSLQQSARSGVPAFAQVTIRSARDAVADVFGKSFAPKGHAFWMAGEELLTITSGLNMNIEKVFAFPDGRSAGEILGIHPLAISPLYASSISAGIACEAIIFGSTDMDPANVQLAAGHGRAVVRAEMVKEAVELGKIAGITVIEIGLTHVTIALPRQLMTRLRSYLLAANTQLRMPAGWEWST